MPPILRDVLAVNRLTGRWPFALRAGVCMAVPVAVGWFLGDVAAGLTATIGGFTSLYGSGRPYLYRARELALVAVALAAAVTLGDWAAAIPFVGVVITSAIAGIAVLICNALMVGPPGAYMFALACAAGVGISVAHENPLRLGALVLCGGAFSWLVHMSGAPLRFRGPERAAVAAARRAVAALPGQLGTEREDRAIDAAARALHESWVVLVNFQPAHPGRNVELQRLRAANHQLHVTFAGLVSDSRTCGAEVPPATEPSSEEIPLGRPSGRRLLLSALAGSHPRRVAAQATVAALLAGSIATTLGIERGYWAIAAAVLVLHNGFDRRRTVVRGVQRLLGTWIGLVLAGVILALHPHGLLLALLLLVLQFLIEMLVVRNYALATVVITPTALTIASAGEPVADLGALLLARGVDTLIGCAVAFLVLFVSGRGYDSSRLRTAMSGLLGSLAVLAAHLAAGEVTSAAARTARRDAQTRAISLLTAYDAALEGGARARRSAERLWPAVTSAERLTYRMLAACWHVQTFRTDPPMTGGEGDSLSAGLTALAAAARTGTAPPSGEPTPAFATGEVAEIRQALSARE